MKIKIFTSLLFACAFLSMQAQMKLTNATQHFLHMVYPTGAPHAPVENLPRDLVEAYQLQKRNGIYSVIIGVVVDEATYSSDNLFSIGAIQNSRLKHLVSVDCPLHQIRNLSNIIGVKVVDVGTPLQSDVIRASIDTRADSAKAGYGLPSGVTGKDVVLAIIDGGFDYTHPTFYSLDLQEYRVKRAWNQKIDTLAAPPAGYSYGSEFNTEADILAAQFDAANTSHGSHVGGIAGGAGGGSLQVGLAHDAELILISSSATPGQLIDALTYLSSYASNQGKPLAVNMSMSLTVGPLDGTALGDMALDLFTGSGRVFVGSAGNRGGVTMHWAYDFTSTDTLMSTIADHIPDATNWVGFDVWGEANSTFELSVTLLDPAGVEVYTTGFFSSTDTGFTQAAIAVGADSLVYRIAIVDASPLNNKPHIDLRVFKSAGYHVAIGIKAQQNTVHMWHNLGSNLALTNIGGYLDPNTLGSSTPVWPGYTSGNTQFTIGAPTSTSFTGIGVGAHSPAQFDAGGQEYPGQIGGFSSKGPTLDGRVRPDLTAPGVSILSAINSFDTTNVATNSVVSIQFNNSTFEFDSKSGTSMSSPVVAGIVALMLEANPNLTALEVRDILRNTAREDSRTGPIPATGSNIWGWGKANAWGAVNEAFNFVSVKSFVRHTTRAIVFPNPTDGTQAQLYLKDYPDGKYNIVITDLSGRPISQIDVNHDGMRNCDLPVNQLTNGMYIITISSKGVVNDVLRMSVAR